jgi:thiamine pyrophosphokinase
VDVAQQQRQTSTVAVIVAGGDPLETDVVERLPRSYTLIAADSGLDEIERLGLTADLVVGDMDSATPDSLSRAAAAGAAVHRHPVDKDATDLELALHLAEQEGFTRAVLIGGRGGRLSHLLGNALVLASPATADMQVEWHVGVATVHVVRPSRTGLIEGTRGDLASLIAVGGPATGVTTTGLRWSLDDAVLHAGSTRGISNEMTEAVATVQILDGAILAIHERN